MSRITAVNTTHLSTFLLHMCFTHSLPPFFPQESAFQFVHGALRWPFFTNTIANTIILIPVALVVACFKTEMFTNDTTVHMLLFVERCTNSVNPSATSVST